MAEQLVWAAVVMSALVVVYLLGVRFLSLDTSLAQRVGDLAFDLEQLRNKVVNECTRHDANYLRQCKQLEDYGASLAVDSKTLGRHDLKIEQLQADALEAGIALRGHNKDFSALHEHCTRIEERIYREEQTRDALATQVADHRGDFEDICKQWREKVGELDAAIEGLKRERENLIRDARNTIAGDLAVASDNLNRKGWRD